MPRKTPCSKCEKPLFTSGSSLPPGQITCRSCRRIEMRTCLCGAAFYPNDHADRKQAFCSKSCGRRFGQPTRPRDGAGREMARARNQRKNLKRRAGNPGRLLSLTETGDRDGWRCHLCRKRVDQRLAYPHPRSASRDHLVPVAVGGTNEPANLALAHWDCNVRRSTGGNVQLQLVG